MCPFGDEFPGESTAYIPEAPGRKGYTEKKFGEETLAYWEFDDLPDDAVVTHVVLMPYRGERVALPWKDGRAVIPEGEVLAGETAEGAIRRICMEQVGIIDPGPSHLGHFRCRATIYSQQLPPGTITFRAVYGIDIGSLADSPSSQGYERRMVLQRDLLALIRDRYFEHWKEYTEALDKFVIRRAKERAAAAN